MTELFEVVTLYCWMECPICHEQSEARKESKWVEFDDTRICLDCFKKGMMWAVREARDKRCLTR